jgi:hypothetical protein
MRLIVAALLVVVAVFAQPPKDVAGWGKIKWGMTVAEAKAVLGDEAVPENAPDQHFTYPTKLRLLNVQIGAGTGTVKIQTKQNSDLVCVVTLLASPPAVEEIPGERPMLFDRLNGMLVEKYGTPKTSDRKSVRSLSGSDSIETTVFWSFPSTSITLRWSEAPRFHVGYVSIEYKAVDKKALNTL